MSVYLKKIILLVCVMNFCCHENAPTCGYGVIPAHHSSCPTHSHLSCLYCVVCLVILSSFHCEFQVSHHLSMLNSCASSSVSFFTLVPSFFFYIVQLFLILFHINYTHTCYVCQAKWNYLYECSADVYKYVPSLTIRQEFKRKFYNNQNLNEGALHGILKALKHHLIALDPDTVKPSVCLMFFKLLHFTSIRLGRSHLVCCVWWCKRLADLWRFRVMVMLCLGYGFFSCYKCVTSQKIVPQLQMQEGGTWCERWWGLWAVSNPLCQ